MLLWSAVHPAREERRSWHRVGHEHGKRRAATVQQWETLIKCNQGSWDYPRFGIFKPRKHGPPEDLRRLITRSIFRQTDAQPPNIKVLRSHHGARDQQPPRPQGKRKGFLTHRTTRTLAAWFAHDRPAWVRLLYAVLDGTHSMRYRHTMLARTCANRVVAAPKKKQEKMNLGAFLTDQCTQTLCPRAVYESMTVMRARATHADGNTDFT